jgi:serine/threonine protein kinase
VRVDAEGTRFGRYRLIELLGRGGMGEVWRAFDTVTERVVALKVLPTEYADDAVYQERFRWEARSAAGLDEPHVVPIYDFGEIDGRLFVTMRLIKGRDLNGILSGGPIDAERAVRIIDQVASALHEAHKVDLVHRDVKPSNILVTDDDFAYLIDFGIARTARQSGLTSSATVIGTLAYMAPERLTTGQTDARADIYSLACVFYECLTGSQPFSGDSLEQQVGGHIALPPPLISDRHENVPAQLDAVIAKGMAKNPDDRYASTREMAQAARAAITAPATRPNPLPPTAAATRPNPLTPTAAALYSNPYPNPYPERQTQSGYVASRPVPWPSPPPPTDRTQYPPMFYSPNLAGRTTSRNGRLIAFTSAAGVLAIAAVVAGIVLSSSGDHGASPPASPTSATPSALPKTGPFTGTFSAAMGSKTLADGTPVTGDDVAAFSETWRLRSACAANGCVATASTGGRYPAKDLVFDNVDGRWLAVTTSRRNCRNREDDEAWNVISLQPQPDGTMSGESTQATTNGCFNKRTVTFTRTADTDISLLPDPASLAPRVVSPAEALYGGYSAETTYANGHANAVNHYGVRTDCLRAGDRCVSTFINTTDEKVFVFGNGTWTQNTEFDDDCSTGGTNRTKYTATMPLPQPPQNPITSLTGHGYADVTTTPGSQCRSQSFDDKFTRTGD